MCVVAKLRNFEEERRREKRSKEKNKKKKKKKNEKKKKKKKKKKKTLHVVTKIPALGSWTHVSCSSKKEGAAKGAPLEHRAWRYCGRDCGKG